MSGALLGDRPRRSARCAAALCMALGALVTFGGCDSAPPPRRLQDQANAQDGLFESVVDNLDHLEQFDTAQILKQICDRLNQWHQQEKPLVVWQADLLVAGLPEDLRNVPAVKLLDAMRYRLPDAWFLQESVWLRDISQVARADQFEDVAVAEQLFDWTVRNIQLEADVDVKKRTTWHRPFETLLLGRGQAIDRAWIFLLLARQQGLDVVLLGTSPGDGEAPRVWLPALVSKGELYLFDCRLGLPIPGPGGRGVATLSQVVADEQLLRRMDLDDEHPYPVRAADLAHVVAFVEGTPIDLSRRMAVVEARLSGKHKMVLTAAPSAVAERVKTLAHVEEVKLWPMPFEIWKWQSKLSESEAIASAEALVLFQVIPNLKTGRAMYFKAAYDGESGAKMMYLLSRRSQSSIDAYRLPDEAAKQVRREDISKVEAAHVIMLQQAKQNASFWLGQIAQEQKDYPVAIDFFTKRTLDAWPNGGPWAPSARYNLARTYEASGETAHAIELYEADKTSPQSHGNRLRARWLKEREQTGEAKSAAETGK